MVVHLPRPLLLLRLIPPTLAELVLLEGVFVVAEAAAVPYGKVAGTPFPGFGLSSPVVVDDSAAVPEALHAV